MPDGNSTMCMHSQIFVALQAVVQGAVGVVVGGAVYPILNAGPLADVPRVVDVEDPDGDALVRESEVFHALVLELL